MDSSSANTNNESGEGSTIGSNVRGKSDPAWGHFSQEVDESGKKSFTCLYCRRTFKGGGIHRMKRHLAGKKGDIAPCNKVPPDVKFQMEENLKGIEEKKQESKQLHNIQGEDPYDMVEEEDDVQEIVPPSANRCKLAAPSKKRKATTSISTSSIPNFFTPRTTSGVQPTIKSVLAGKEAKKRVDAAFAKWAYDCCMPTNYVNSIYYQPFLDAVASFGLGYKGPNYHALRVNLLHDAKKEVSLLVDSFRSHWAEIGCTVMADGWTDTRGRTLINFLVYCSRGLTFVKSVDASDIVKDAKTLFKLFCDVIEWVGPSNVVHIVTDNAANYVLAGRLLCEKYKTLSWSPCAAHCLNLMLKDIAKMSHVEDIAKRASKITIFVYNHVFLLSWLRKRSGWKEIIRPGPTRFATTFIAIKSLLEHKHDLQALVTSKYFVESRYSKDKKAKDVISVVLENKFWNDCFIVVKIVEPLIRLLRIVDSDDRPAMGYVYDGMRRAIMGVKKVFRNKKHLYRPYTSIMKGRWDRQLCKNIHAAAYWLNPAFHYDPTIFVNKPEVASSIVQVIEHKVVSGRTKMMDETVIFHDRLKSFGGELALKTSKTMQPSDWWKMFGTDVPKLQKLAVRILSQTAASSGCERNWSVFERIHTKRRNRLEHQRLNDLVYVHYNLRLKNRLHDKKKTYDPVDYESIDKTEAWILEEEEEEEEVNEGPFLNYEDLEKELYEEGSTPIEGPSNNAQEEDVENLMMNDNVDGGIDYGTFEGGSDAPPGFALQDEDSDD